MPTNRVIHIGILVVVASALIWLGAEFTRRVEWILPYTFAVGVALILIGAGVEYWKQKKGRGVDESQ